MTGEKPDPRVLAARNAYYCVPPDTPLPPGASLEGFRRALAAADAVSPGEARYRKALVRARGAVAALRSALECGETYSGTLRSEVETAQYEIVEALSGSQSPRKTP
jgi:hypothetical protein